MKTARISVITIIAMFLIASSVFASNWIWGSYNDYQVAQVMINGEWRQFDVPAIVMDGRILVPLRGVSEALGMKVEWSATEQSAFIYDPYYDPDVSDYFVEYEIKLSGDEKFIRTINKALGILHQRQMGWYIYISDNINEIRTGQLSTSNPLAGMQVNVDTGVITIREDYGYLDPVITAADLVHEARHVVQYKQGINFSSARDRERDASVYNIQILKSLNAPKEVVEYYLQADEWWDD